MPARPTLRKTKIVATIGPACGSPEMLKSMIDAGMNVARLDFAVGDHKSHGIEIGNLNQALK